MDSRRIIKRRKKSLRSRWLLIWFQRAWIFRSMTLWRNHPMKCSRSCRSTSNRRKQRKSKRSLKTWGLMNWKLTLRVLLNNWDRWWRTKLCNWERHCRMKRIHWHSQSLISSTQWSIYIISTLSRSSSSTLKWSISRKWSSRRTILS